MGGKGGGGSYVAPFDTWVSTMAQNPQFKQGFEAQRKNYADEKSWYDNFGGYQQVAPNGSRVSPDLYKGIFTNLYGTYTPPPAPAPEPSPAPVEAPPVAPVPEPEAPPPVGGTPIESGGAIDQPTTGDQLGGAVLNPPQYWIGGVNQYEQANPSTGRNQTGAMTTTQT